MSCRGKRAHLDMGLPLCKSHLPPAQASFFLPWRVLITAWVDATQTSKQGFASQQAQECKTNR